MASGDAPLQGKDCRLGVDGPVRNRQMDALGSSPTEDLRIFDNGLVTVLGSLLE